MKERGVSEVSSGFYDAFYLFFAHTPLMLFSLTNSNQIKVSSSLI
jgi:hypothetical protein